ncbi:MAG: hypothetical protein ABFC12_06575 [Methanobacterium sp.]
MVLHIPYQDHQARIRSIERSGYHLLDFFLVHSIWWSYFYQPYEEHVKNLIEKYQGNKEVLKALKIEEAEILMFKENPEDNSSIFLYNAENLKKDKLEVIFVFTSQNFGIFYKTA